MPLFALLLLGLAAQNPVASIFSFKPLVLLRRDHLLPLPTALQRFLLIHFYKLPEKLHVAQFDPWISFAALIMLLALVGAALLYERPARRFVSRWSTGDGVPTGNGLP